MTTVSVDGSFAEFVFAGLTELLDLLRFTPVPGENPALWESIHGTGRLLTYLSSVTACLVCLAWVLTRGRETVFGDADANGADADVADADVADADAADVPIRAGAVFLGVAALNLVFPPTMARVYLSVDAASTWIATEGLVTQLDAVATASTDSAQWTAVASLTALPTVVLAALGVARFLFLLFVLPLAPLLLQLRVVPHPGVKRITRGVNRRIFGAVVAALPALAALHLLGDLLASAAPAPLAAGVAVMVILSVSVVAFVATYRLVPRVVERCSALVTGSRSWDRMPTARSNT